MKLASGFESIKSKNQCFVNDKDAFMKLDQFLKYQGKVATGGEAKHLIISGFVRVNGSIETRRGRKLRLGDHVSIDTNEFIVSET